MVNNQEPRSTRWLVIEVAMLAGVVLVLGSLLRQSLWIDECPPLEITAGSLADTFRMALRYGGHPPLFFLLLWAVRHLFGSAEWVLRAPSFLAVLLAAGCLFGMVRESFGRRKALHAVLLFLSLPVVTGAAVFERPYAFGILGAVIAMRALLHWHRSQSRWALAAFTVAAAVTVNFHTLNATLFLAVFFFLVQVGYPLRRIAATFALPGLFVAASLSWFVSRVYSMAAQAEKLSYSTVPFVSELVEALLPWPLLAALLLAWLLLRRAGVPRPYRLDARHASDLEILALFVFLVPIGFCFFVSVVTPAQIFVPRHYGVSAIGEAILLLAIVVRLVEERFVAPVVLTVSAVFLVTVRIVRSQEGSEQWRAISAYINEINSDGARTVLLDSGFIEATRNEWLEERPLRDFLLSPVRYYGMKGELVPIPPGPGWPVSSEYLPPILAKLRAAGTPFIVVTAWPREFYRQFFDYELGKGCYQIAERDFHPGRVMVFSPKTGQDPVCQRSSEPSESAHPTDSHHSDAVPQ